MSEPDDAAGRSRRALERIAPGASDLLARLTGHLPGPRIAAAATAAALGTIASLIVALAVALATDDRSLLDLAGDDGAAEETFRQAVAFTMADLEAGDGAGFGFRVTPALFLLVPVLATAAAAALLGDRAGGPGARARWAWVAATGFFFGLAMLLAAVSAGTAEFDAATAAHPAGSARFSLAGALLLGTLWGAAGASLRAPGEAGAHSALTALVRLAAAAVRPLVLLLALSACIGTVAWTVETLRADGGDLASPRAERPALQATVENGLYVVEHGIHFTELAAGVRFHAPRDSSTLHQPLPVSTEEGAPSGDNRLLDYRGHAPAWVLVVLLMMSAVAALLALYGGFAVSRLRGASSPALGAAWGALIGPAWSLSMVLLNAVVHKDLFGRADGESVFAIFLLAGSLIGALGGRLAADAQHGTEVETSA